MPRLIEDLASTACDPNALNTAKIIQLLLINGGAGAVLGLCFVAGVLVLDVAQIRTMLVGADDWLVPVVLLSMGSSVTFASVAMGGAIMLLPKDEPTSRPPSQGRGTGILNGTALIPAAVKVRAGRNPRHPAN